MRVFEIFGERIAEGFDAVGFGRSYLSPNGFVSIPTNLIAGTLVVCNVKVMDSDVPLSKIPKDALYSRQIGFSATIDDMHIKIVVTDAFLSKHVR